MADTLEIGFALTGDGKVMNAFSRFAVLAETATTRLNALTAALNVATDAQRSLNAEAEKYNRLQGNTPAIGIGRSLAVGGSSGSGSSRGRTSGPFQRRQSLAQESAAVLASGDENHAADVRIAQAHNNKQIEKVMAAPKGMTDRLFDVLKTSRFSLGGGKAEIMPLVGKALGAITESLGPELMAVAGPVGAVASAAALASKAIFDLSKASAEAGAAYTKFAYLIGNNGAGASKALAVGRMAGLDASGTSALAESLNNAITGSGTGRIYGLRVGVMNRGGPYGDVDHADNLVQAIEGLRGIKDFSERVRTMNALGLQGAAGAVTTSDRQYGYAGSDAAVRRSIMDPAFLQKSADFQAALGRLEGSWNNFMMAMGKPGQDAMINVLNSTAIALNGLAVAVNSPGMQTALKLFGVVANPIGAAFSGIDPHTQALQANTDALNRQTSRLEQPGVYGRDMDGRLARAFPAGVGYGGDAPRNAFDGYSHRRAEMMANGYAMSAF